MDANANVRLCNSDTMEVEWLLAKTCAPTSEPPFHTVSDIHDHNCLLKLSSFRESNRISQYKMINGNTNAPIGNNISGEEEAKYPKQANCSLDIYSRGLVRNQEQDSEVQYVYKWKY